MKENRRLLKEVLKDIRHDMTDEEVLNLLADSKISENPTAEKYTLGQRAADAIARFAGSWAFIFAFTGVLILWMVINTILASNAFDPYPFILLNLVLSCVAAIQAPLIMMSQNRQEEKDRCRAENDYKVNLKTEIMIEDLYDKVNAILAKQSALEKKLIEQEEKVWAVNRILEVMQADSFSWEESAKGKEAGLTEILDTLIDDAYERGVLEENSVVYRDLFDTKLMGSLTPRPVQVMKKFQQLQEESSQRATDWYYQFSQDTNYIRKDRVAKDIRWKTETEYGEIDISINQSKPEKDPKAIAAARNQPASDYPRCMLCEENVGYAGRLNYPARQNHRIVPVIINNTDWYLQYSPYVYYNEHCICFNKVHTPMKIDKACFAKLLDFVRQFPHYFVGSNADLPIVGGSILAHDHFQGGHYTFAMERAPIETEISFEGYEDVKAGIVKWPMSVIRLNAKEPERLIDLADKILGSWRGYTDEAAMILAETDGEPHNTITPIARRRGEDFELDLVLRNNLTTPDHPLGIYHPHEEFHHIKKENIGLIEVMGLAILPGRLKKELEAVEEKLLSGEDMTEDPLTKSHAKWAADIAANYEITAENAKEIVQKETGIVFSKVLEQAGVYKRTPEGKEAFLRFINQV